MTAQNFSVDLHGMVDLLSNHLYSGPQVFVRELRQNANDAIQPDALKTQATKAPSDSEHSVDGRPALTVTDDGVGLTRHEAETFMGVIGRSSKRDEIGMARAILVAGSGLASACDRRRNHEFWRVVAAASGRLAHANRRRVPPARTPRHSPRCWPAARQRSERGSQYRSVPETLDQLP